MVFYCRELVKDPLYDRSAPLACLEIPSEILYGSCCVHAMEATRTAHTLQSLRPPHGGDETQSPHDSAELGRKRRLLPGVARSRCVRGEAAAESMSAAEDEQSPEGVLLIAPSPPGGLRAAAEEDQDQDQDQDQDPLELSYLAEDEDEGSGSSVDYGFITAVSCLLTGISLVAITYTVPREARVEPDGVSAREMERLERDKARLGAHLDRCVMAGLCLLTLGGVLLSSLLTASMWKAEMLRRRAVLAHAQHASNLYGSIGWRTVTGCGPDEDSEVLGYARD
ncbi:transmembrane protein 74B [Entelurus aequoreus]|uniref:transmembrane protein 74B n=1 Tax=Entelurus aequoreus TaxID=161455 RepID=UPI002B1D4BCC|nr:transmembrane protein 74B [Entelurus aequoreus]